MQKIDFVILWVDGNDPVWQKEKAKFSPEKSSDDTAVRYRDWETLRYFFRGVESFAPWVNKIHFVTSGHYPSWLNLNHKKLNFIRHKDFIDQKYLPLFNSNAIELNLPSLKSLSNHFVLFNDDMFLIRPTQPTDFFKNNLPCDSAILSPIIPKGSDGFHKCLANNVAIINNNFQKHLSKKWFSPKYYFDLFRNLALSPWHNFPGFYNPHIPISFDKSLIKKSLALDPIATETTKSSRFRDNNTNISIWLARYYQLITNNFYPRSIKFGQNFEYKKDNSKMYSAIKNQSYSTICLNDVPDDYDFESEKQKTLAAFNSILPEKSAFELSEKISNHRKDN
ncbi:MAG: stealth family protein [Candidatus Saccharibacteria bacterium]|nr:stealth family protein [Candidatus Saccharibacteria bacterium]